MSVLPQPQPVSALRPLSDQVSTVPATSTVAQVSSKDSIMEATTPANPTMRYIERSMGDSEQSYFLPSRSSLGVNDMYLHIGFRAPEKLLVHERVCLVWAILRTQHPLLGSSVEMHDYTDIRFKYVPPVTVLTALEDANANLEFSTKSKDELIDTYLNGPRTLSSERLSRLVISQPEVKSDDQSTAQYEFMVCATHYIGDGMSLHQFANNFFSLLGGEKQSAELEKDLLAQIELNRELPDGLESRFPQQPGGKAALFRQAVSRVDFNLSQSRLIGGHSFPKNPNGNQPLHTVVPTVPFSREATKDILKACKARGVSISSALFALCNISWSTICKTNWEMPMMFYSALNLRPNLRANQGLNDSYWFLAVGYFNVILPSFLPQSSPISDTFWHRARIAQAQSKSAATSPMLISRSREMAKLRGQRARQWAKEDDDRERGILPKPASTIEPGNKKPKIRSDALMGLSLLGNLDGMYKHAAFPDITLSTLTTGSRQRPGGMLLFSYTFAGRLWLSLGYDENGFDKDVVQNFWQTLLQGVEGLGR